ncbi:transmembrane and coiled-coil domain protein 3 [Chanos chanos]|uniref:Transmembrane and coiled-coil domain protein 3 n=1 Tax=Chanos chanos TaxID=29144 RepID=A0A6J2WX58_CHACN|nr:transmembrane and coiled-coil domain protein 3 [Chanos chanos]
MSAPTSILNTGSDSCLALAGQRNVQTQPSQLDKLHQKMLRVTEQLRIEKIQREDHFSEYLQLVRNADKQQSKRIKQVFEKKNQKSTQNMARLQKKLEQYHQKIREIESSGEVPTQVSLKDFKVISKDNLKECVDGRQASLNKAKTLGPSSSQPYFDSKRASFARNSFGSADNITHLKSSAETYGVLGRSGALTAKHKYSSDDECSTETSLSVESNGQSRVLLSGVGTWQCAESSIRLEQAMEEIRLVREVQNQLAEDLGALTVQLKQDSEVMRQSLQEECYRLEQLEDQLSDLTELHQRETTSLKQELASMEEKVAYQANEQARDLQEALEVCQTRMSKLELQQQQQQQIIQLESTDAKVLLGKCINIMLAIATVILMCTSTMAKFTSLLLRSRMHVCGTLVCVFLLGFGWSSWEHVQCAVQRMLLPS